MIMEIIVFILNMKERERERKREREKFNNVDKVLNVNNN